MHDIDGDFLFISPLLATYPHRDFIGTSPYLCRKIPERTKAHRPMFISVYLRTRIILEILLFLTLHLIFYRKITLKSDFSCTSQNNSLPWHREPAPRDVCTLSAEGSRHIKKAFIDALFWHSEISQISMLVSGLSNGRCPTGYRLSLVCLFGTAFAYIHMRTRVP